MSQDTATAVVTQTMNAGGTSGGGGLTESRGAVKENKTEAKKDPESRKPKFGTYNHIMHVHVQCTCSIIQCTKLQ